MKRIGLIGGVSPESTVIYYRLLNAAARAAFGGDVSAEMVIHSLNFGRMHELYRACDWDSFKKTVVAAGKSLEAAGCEVLAISSNTVNLAADELAAAAGVPVIYLLEALSEEMTRRSAIKPLLLGTPVVMEGEFYRAALKERYGYDTDIPSAEDREQVRRVIFDELVEGVVNDVSRASYLKIIERGRQAGADSVILGCTEIGMLIAQEHVDMPVFDTTLIHAKAIADFAFRSGT